MLPGLIQGMNNHLGTMPISRNYFTGIVSINGDIVEAVMETRGARSLLDYTSIINIGLQVKVAAEERHFGYYWGPSGKSVLFKGKVQGLVSA